MKIKFILFLFFKLFFFNCILYSDEVEIVSDNIKILDNGKIIESIQTNAIIKKKDYILKEIIQYIIRIQKLLNSIKMFYLMIELKILQLKLKMQNIFKN